MTTTEINGATYHGVIVTRNDDEPRIHIIEPALIPKTEPERGKVEKAVRRMAVAMLWGCACGLVFAGGMYAERRTNETPDEPTRFTIVGSVPAESNPPVWVDPELGEK